MKSTYKPKASHPKLPKVFADVMKPIKKAVAAKKK